jgi:hypothetical protein
VAQNPTALEDLARKSDLTAILFHILATITPENDILTLLAARASDVALKQARDLKAEKSLVCILS